MRNNYENEEKVSLAWGNDNATGLFAQIFDKDGELILEMDQGKQKGFPFGEKEFNEKEFVDTCDKYSFPDAKKDYFEYKARFISDLGNMLEAPFIGYVFDSNGLHSGANFLSGPVECIEFLQKNFDKPITITDILDRLLYKNHTY